MALLPGLYICPPSPFCLCILVVTRARCPPVMQSHSAVQQAAQSSGLLAAINTRSSQALLLLSASSLPHLPTLALLFNSLFSLEGLHLAGWQAHGGRGREQRQVIPTQPQAANLEPELAEGKRSWFGAFVSTLLYLKGAALQRPACRRAGYKHCSGVSRLLPARGWRGRAAGAAAGGLLVLARGSREAAAAAPTAPPRAAPRAGCGGGASAASLAGNLRRHLVGLGHHLVDVAVLSTLEGEGGGAGE